MPPTADSPGAAIAPVTDLFEHYPGQWMVSGGWALDLFAGRVRRDHADVDVMIRSDDVAMFADFFDDRAPRVVDHRTGDVLPWSSGVALTTGRHTLTFDADAPPIEVVLGDADGGDWVFHRGRGNVRREWRLICLRDGDGIPFLAPEVVLLFKSRGTRPKDDGDFADVVSLLGRERLTWLRSRLTPPDAPDHPWAARIDARLAGPDGGTTAQS